MTMRARSVDSIDGNPDRPAMAQKNGKRKSARPAFSIGKYRLAVQVAFVLVCLWIGVEFHFFVRYLASGGQTTFVSRPPGAEAFLPIGSLMSLYYFFLTGEVHPAHPAGLFILVAILVVSLVFGKSFCSWICPVGFLSESLGDWSEKLFGRRMKLPRLLDWPLRSLKYLLLVFFVYAIFFLMTAASLKSFLDSPYNLVADVKMYYFFAEISTFALWTLLVLFVLSFFVRNFWCRYLCPYGALLGLLSLLRPFKIRRNVDSCLDCTLCAKACPANIKVDQVTAVVSDECTTCLSCIDVCPVERTLELKATPKRLGVSRKTVAVGVVAIYGLICGAAMISDRWDNNITKEDYQHHQQYLQGYGHPTGASEIEVLNEQSGQSKAANEDSQVDTYQPSR